MINFKSTDYSMKKVRFENIHESNLSGDTECHSPRPYVHIGLKCSANDKQTISNKKGTEAVQLLECSNSVPYPSLNRTQLFKKWCRLENDDQIIPSNDLELSLLDSHYYKSKKVFGTDKNSTGSNNVHDFFLPNHYPIKLDAAKSKQSHIPTSEDKENFKSTDCHEENNFISCHCSNCKHTHRLSINSDHIYACNNCNSNQSQNYLRTVTNEAHGFYLKGNENKCKYFNVSQNLQNCVGCSCKSLISITKPNENCRTHRSASLDDALELKTQAVKRFEQNRRFSSDYEKENCISKSKHEPTVADLFEIIKFQNEQLQILQEKVDRFIGENRNQPQSFPVQSYLTKHVALEAVGANDHKMSIGVMTSFEVVRTSTIINKEVSKHQTENAQVQCNRSQISINGIVAKANPVNINFLDGIQTNKREQLSTPLEINKLNGESDTEDKTVQDLSLCGLQVDNEITPELSPDQSMYLDLKDYSESESDNEHSNVGWTYYNRVMTHVNDVLQDSEMPSSASALYQETLQRCMQMKFDKTNISSSKRVTFGDHHQDNGQCHARAITDTSLKMNQLAAKYLKGASTPLFLQSQKSYVLPNIAYSENFLDK